MRYSGKSVADYVVFTFLFAAAVFLTGRVAMEWAPEREAREASAFEEEQQVVLIDPGHGGEDGGASGADGTLEKELNLLISQNVRDIFTLFGVRAEMTRAGDHLLYDYYNDLDDYTGKMKTYDLRNRLKMAESGNTALYLGIHMNKFSQPKYRGLQVYFSPNHDGSQKAAQLIQTYTKRWLQPENKREIKRATSSIYILKRITVPAVLVECGFLSNETECALLNTADYRLQLAGVITAAGLEWLGG